MNPPIRTEALTRRYGRHMALDGLDLAVPDGSIFGLVGPNGAGKTTVIKMLMRLLRPSSGHAEVLGREATRLGPAELAQIGYVSENQKLPDWMPMAYFMNYLRPFYPAWDDALAAELIRQFDLPPGRKLRHLSHGMRMKAAMAAALAYRPRLIILDEPFTGLDPLVRDELIEGFLPRAENTTVFVSSHDLAEIENFASHIGFLDHGRLQFSEGMSSLAERFREVEVTLRAPSAREAGWAEWPPTWLQAQRSAAVVRFVDSQFEEGRTMAEVRRVFGESLQVAVNPMPLRSIFVALAKASRRAA
ncbi:MAG TPA: ABC transporter ATP-binding protein [Bryobacteraceae bacterium]|jgi:ABC-2 type transport system ATP-binding protein|nr:ABC transporter ATP-binding protein [Bryobacteraceae bacterium]